MYEAIITVTAQVVASLLVTLIGVFGAWLTSKIGKRVELTNINKAKDELIAAAQQTVMELQQTVVDKLKDAAEDGKLSNQEINELGTLLLKMTKEKMSLPSINVLVAAGVDIDALIRGAGEALINRMHEGDY